MTGRGWARKQCLNPGGIAETSARVPGARRRRVSRNWSPRGEETEAGVQRTRRQRLESGQGGDGGGVPRDKELAAGARRSRLLRLEPGGTRREQLHSGGHRDDGWLQWGGGCPAKLTAPSHHARGSPSRAARSSRAGGPKVISWGGGRSSPRAPRIAADGAARASGRGCGACPGQPWEAAARVPLRPPNHPRADGAARPRAGTLRTVEQPGADLPASSDAVALASPVLAPPPCP